MGESINISTPLAPLSERIVRAIVAHRCTEHGLPSTSTHPDFAEHPGDRRLMDAVLREVFRADAPPAQAAFDLVEGIAQDMEADGRKNFASNLRAGFARGTGGIDASYLRELVVGGLRGRP